MSADQEAPQAVRQITINVSAKTDAALARRQAAEGLNPTTLFNRAMQVYDLVAQAQEDGDGTLVLYGKKVTFE